MNDIRTNDNNNNNYIHNHHHHHHPDHENNMNHDDSAQETTTSSLKDQQQQQQQSSSSSVKKKKKKKNESSGDASSNNYKSNLTLISNSHSNHDNSEDYDDRKDDDDVCMNESASDQSSSITLKGEEEEASSNNHNTTRTRNSTDSKNTNNHKPPPPPHNNNNSSQSINPDSITEDATGRLPILPTMDMFTIPPECPDSPHDHDTQQDFSINPDNVKHKQDNVKQSTKEGHAEKPTSQSPPSSGPRFKSVISPPSLSSISSAAYKPNKRQSDTTSYTSPSAIIVNTGDQVIDVSAFQSPPTPQIINHAEDGVNIGNIPWHRKVSRWWTRMLTKHCRSCRRKTNGHRNG